MAWSWSHTDKAYEYAEAALRRCPPSLLEICWAEIATYRDGAESVDDGIAVYARHLEEAKRFTPELLADQIWEFASEQQICTNGGWEAWICPYGCHRVPFSPAEESEDD